MGSNARWRLLEELRMCRPEHAGGETWLKQPVGCPSLWREIKVISGVVRVSPVHVSTVIKAPFPPSVHECVEVVGDV